MKFTAKQIAEILNGSIVGNPDIEVKTLSKIEEGKAGSLSFLSNPKYSPHIYTTKASVVIVNDTFVAEKELETTLIKVSDAYGAFSTLLEFYNQVKNTKKGREKPYFFGSNSTIGSDEYLGAFSYVGEHVKIGKNVKIYPNVFIDDHVVIGDNCTLFAGVKIYSDTVIGSNCTLHAGVIIGADGFGFAPNDNGNYKKIPQTGNVIIEDFVDIGAATTIDRATLGSTIIRSGVKLDNQIQIGHNVEIGKNTVIAAQTGIAGSAKIGENCMIGGQVGIVGHITIGNYVKVGAQSGITKNIQDNEVLHGTPAFNISDFNKSYVLFRNLPKMAAVVNQLEKEFKTQKE